MSRGRYLQHKKHNGPEWRLTERLIAFLAPHSCLFCGLEGKLVCGWCWVEVVKTVPSRCYRCHQLAQDNKTCQKCRKQTKLAHVWVATEYSEVAKKLVYDLKFARKQAAVEPISRAMLERLPYLPDNVMVVHVPTATSRVRQRGYDQAKLLARSIARHKELECLDLLLRSGQSRQVGSTRQQRIVQIAQAFTTKHRGNINNSHILLVDDVMTTGATLEAAAAVLRKAGARSVDAVVFAQKM